MLPRPNIIISKCLNFDHCRFNGDMINDSFLLKLGKYVHYIPVCPEVGIGLGTPRSPLRLYANKENIHLYQPSSELDLTEKMKEFSKSFLATQKNIEGFIMKNRSPSCGIKDVKLYDGIDAYSLKNGSTSGIFGNKIIEMFQGIPVEDEGRLKNFRLREAFLSKIFCLADFRELRGKGSISDLQKFQAKNKYLFMAYSQEKQVLLGRLIAEYDKTNLDLIFHEYFQILCELFSDTAKTGNLINAYTHIFGYFKKSCSTEEKSFFLDMLDVYKEGRVPTTAITSILKTWALRDKSEYILMQTILDPYPRELIELSDSGKLLRL